MNNGICGLLERLQERYGSPISMSLKEFLAEKYGKAELAEDGDHVEPGLGEVGNSPGNGGMGGTAGDEGTIISGDKLSKKYLIFTEDEEVNRGILQGILDSYRNIKVRLKRACLTNVTVQKLIEKFETEITIILGKENLNHPRKVAEKLKSALKKTVVKLYAYEGCIKVLDAFFESAHLEAVRYEKGRYLTEDDLEYLDEGCIQADMVPTDRKEEKYKVIEMIQPIVRWGYDDDGEKEFVFIAGRCRFYSYKSKSAGY